MKPASPEFFETSIDNYTFESQPETHEKNKLTKVFKKSAFGNKFLWQFPDYIGRRVVNVSPDGFTVILFGNEYFGTTIRNDDVINILFIYEKDKKSKGFTYKDIKKITLKDEIAKHDLFINGGGWISISETLTLQSVDWKNKTIHFKQVEFKF